VLKTGCQWRQLPREFPSWSAVYYDFRRWRLDGTWPRIHDTLRARRRHQHPTAGCLDSQSVKGTSTPGARGFDAGKKINGRQRHILVDTLGLLRVVLVTAASVQDRDGARQLLRHLPGPCKRLRKMWVDGGYSGRLVEGVASRFQFVLSVVLRPKEVRRFVLLPRRWVVERTFAWLNLSRRLSKDYERLMPTSETWIDLAMIKLMVNRLA
jgi:putative transposase